MKFFVFSDIHGCYSSLIRGLKESGYEPNNLDHTLLFLGDAFDKESNERDDYGLYCFLKENVENGKLIWIRGNHESFLLSAIEKGSPTHFTEKTIRNISCGLNIKNENLSGEEQVQSLIDHGVYSFIKDNALNFYETKDYVFTHGTIPYLKKENMYLDNWRDYPKDKWEAFRSCNGMKMVLTGVKIPGKTLVCGHVGNYFGYITKHYPELSIGSKEFNKLGDKLKKECRENPKPFDIFYGDGVIGLDGNAYKRGRVNILVVEQ